MTNIDKFSELVKDQFTYGGVKYAPKNSTKREATDELFDKHGKNWLIGTVDKYTYRYSNIKGSDLDYKAERDLLKVGCYMYILWLKRGFQITKKGIDSPPLDTNVEQKAKYYSEFLEVSKKDLIKNQLFYDKTKFSQVSSELAKWSKKDWIKLAEADLITIYNIIFMEWAKHYATKTKHDTDTYGKEQAK